MAAPNQPGDVDAASEARTLRFTMATTELERLEMDLLLLAIYRHHGFDFRSYAPASLHRRIRKHMESVQVATISRLTELILHEPSALQRLLHDLSVNVTAMFRDPSFFAEFRSSVVPLLRTYPTVRIWHAGCSTGEEVYAMAILLEEEGLYERCRIYATDMDSTVLDHARQGIFPLSRMKEYTANYFLGGGKRSLSAPRRVVGQGNRPLQKRGRRGQPAALFRPPGGALEL